MTQVSRITVSWTPETSPRVSAIQIQSRIVGDTAWTMQTSAYDPTAGQYVFTSNAPGANVEVQTRFRMSNGVYSPWTDNTVQTTGTVTPYAEVTGTPSSLEQINSTEGSKLGGIQPGADVTAQNTAKDTSAVNGVASSTITSQLSATNAQVFNTTPPDIPTNLALSSSVSADSLGNQIVTMKATWTASTASDTVGYILDIAENGGNFVPFDVGAVTSYSFVVPAATAVQAQVAAYDRNTNKSAFSSPFSITATKDTTPPGRGR